MNNILLFQTNYTKVFGDDKENQIPKDRFENIIELICSISKCSKITIDGNKVLTLKEMYKYFFNKELEWA